MVKAWCLWGLLLQSTFVQMHGASVFEEEAVLLAGEGFYPNWMERLLPVTNNLTLADLCIPGSHDSTTYDSSIKVAENIGSLIPKEFLNAAKMAAKVYPAGLELIKNLALTQVLTMTQQLNAGIRFFDFRITYTSTEVEGEPYAFYSVHTVQTLQPAIVYFQQIRTWLDAHPKEIVVFWLSRHGSVGATGQNQYPGVTPQLKQEFWKEILEVFKGVTWDTEKCIYNTTTIQALLSNSCRVLFFATDYAEFTGSSRYAYDAKKSVTNSWLGSVSGSPWSKGSLETVQNIFENMAETVSTHKKDDRFFLMSLAESPSASFITYRMKTDLPMITSPPIEECAKLMELPNSNFCPSDLLSLTRLNNYYQQVALETAYLNNYRFPMAFYLDSIDIDGTIRTGVKEYNASTPRMNAQGHEKYAFVATVIGATLNRVCGSFRDLYNPKNPKHPNNDYPSADGNTEFTRHCHILLQSIYRMRAQYPVRLIEDRAHGRSQNPNLQRLTLTPTPPTSPSGSPTTLTPTITPTSVQEGKENLVSSSPRKFDVTVWPCGFATAFAYLVSYM